MTIVEKSAQYFEKKHLISMATDHEDIAKALEDGSYFVEARKWYNAVYISPISERVFFIVITLIAAVIFVMAILSFMYLLPIKPRIPFVYRAKDIVGEIPNMIRLKSPTEPTNPALMRYYVSTYVNMRESYSESRFLVNRSFMQYYSDNNVFDEYNRQTHPSNPRSPIRLYGKYITLEAKIEKVTFERTQAGPSRAMVDFSTDEIGPDGRKKAQWTATVAFYYTDLIERDVIDPKTGDFTLEMDKPTFQVVSYDVKERLALPTNDKK